MEINHILIGFGLAFVGFITPAMLNMTTVRTSIEKGVRSGVLFGAGAATINAIHGLISFTFLKFLDDNPDIILWLKRAGVFILISLAIFFYQKSKKVAEGKQSKENVPTYLQGVAMSAINMLGLPYYLAAGLILEAEGYLVATAPYTYFLALGIFLGGTSMFAIYALGADTIARKSEFVTKNINRILAVIFIGLAVIVGANLIFA